MVGYLQDKELELRKRALAAESEIYRETLKLEFHNLRLYGASVKRRLSVFRAIGPIMLAVAPIAAMLVKRRTEARLGVFGKALRGWQLYRKFAPALGILLARWNTRRSGSNAT